MALTDLIGGSLGDVAAKLIGMFKVPPEKALEHEAEMAHIQQEAQDHIVAAAQAEIEAASANIRADAQSGDKFTQRARPSFMYIMEATIVYNFIVAPLLGKAPVQMPDALFWLFGSAVLGYTGARSWEKFMGAPGESKFSFMGLTASQTSPEGPIKGSK
jgi:hypothetical protein